MGQINQKNTSSPNTPPSGYTGFYFDASGVAKKIDDTGSSSDLAVPSIVPANYRENNTVLFDKDYIIGINSSARTGNILFDFTGAELGATSVMRHNDASAFTFPTEAVLMFASADISTTVDNYFLFVLVDKTASSEVVHVFHAMEGGIA